MFGEHEWLRGIFCEHGHHDSAGEFGDGCDVWHIDYVDGDGDAAELDNGAYGDGDFL